jgi:hypothetical protein
VTVSALLVDKHYKPESHLKICLLVAEVAETDAMEDIQLPPGAIGKTQESSPDGSITILLDAQPMPSHLATTTPQENTNHVAHPSQPPNAIRLALQDIPRLSLLINYTEIQSTLFHLKLLRSKPKS